MNKFQLLERLIEFAVKCIKFTEKLKPCKASSILEGQLIRSGTSPANNYSEAMDAESNNDFIHKLKVCLKELRESNTTLQIVKKAELRSEKILLEELIKESSELTAIFVSSLKTLRTQNIPATTKSISNQNPNCKS
jgi:four helix bundle protein